jgi:hypothetical protein
MTSALELTCREIATDLTSNVDGLAGATVHLLTPEDPEKLQVPKDGKRHLAVWPVGESAGPAQTATGFANDADDITEFYAVLIWEGAKVHLPQSDQ